MKMSTRWWDSKAEESGSSEVADKIHTGRSRNDQVSLDLRLWLRDEIDGCLDLLWELLASLVRAAQRDPDAIRARPDIRTRVALRPVLWTHYLAGIFRVCSPRDPGSV